MFLNTNGGAFLGCVCWPVEGMHEFVFLGIIDADDCTWHQSEWCHLLHTQVHGALLAELEFNDSYEEFYQLHKLLL